LENTAIPPQPTMQALLLVAQFGDDLPSRDHPRCEEELLDRLAVLLDFDVALLYERVSVSRHLRLVTTVGVSGDIGGNVSVLELSAGTEVLEDLGNEHDPRTALIKGLGVLHHVAFPLPAIGNVLGVVHFGRRADRPFEPDTLTVLEATAAQVARLARAGRLRDSLRASEQRFRVLVESAMQATWETNSKGDVVEHSESWSRYTGQAPSEFLGRGWLDVVHPEDQGTVAAQWGTAVRLGTVFRSEVRIWCGPGGWRWTQVFAAPIKDDSGAVLKFVGMNLDITQRKSAELALVEADKEKDRFIAVLAHELRNPLAPIRSGVELMLNKTTSEVVRARVLAVIQRQVTHLVRLVGDLIDTSRIRTGKLHVIRERVNLATVVTAAIESIQPALDAKHQRVDAKWLEQCDLVVEADAARLAQAFANILNNSAKFSPEHARIRIEVTEGDKAVEVRIRDEGPGIEEGELTTIFKLFVQSSRHDKHDGLGIGLAVVDELVKLHGGTVTARNEADGAGAVFEVKLPLAPPLGAHDHETARAVSGEALHSTRILVVDDNFDAADTIAALIEAEGHTVRIAHDGAEALKEAQVFQPEIIFMDLGMPVMGGLEATREIRKLFLSQRPYIIALTGWSAQADKAATREAGCDAHLSKPTEMTDVLGAIVKAKANEARQS
jgi:PAS domain S-box-containing protein